MEAHRCADAEERPWKAAGLDPHKLPTPLVTAFDALCGHYARTFVQWRDVGVRVPPCFIVVCNNTATSKLVYDYIAGFERENDDGTSRLEAGRLELFRNHDEHGNWLARPRTVLVDSEQLESGEALDDAFRGVAAYEIARFREKSSTAPVTRAPATPSPTRIYCAG